MRPFPPPPPTTPHTSPHLYTPPKPPITPRPLHILRYQEPRVNLRPPPTIHSDRPILPYIQRHHDRRVGCDALAIKHPFQLHVQMGDERVAVEEDYEAVVWKECEERVGFYPCSV